MFWRRYSHDSTWPTVNQLYTGKLAGNSNPTDNFNLHAGEQFIKHSFHVLEFVMKLLVFPRNQEIVLLVKQGIVIGVPLCELY